MIEITVKKTLGEFNLDATLADDKFICLTGRNGSGKSTLMRIIGGLIFPDSGYVRLNSRDITKLPIEVRNVSFVSPDSIIPHLQVEKHLIWGAERKGIKVPDEYLNNLKQKLGIVAVDIRADQLSVGMRARLALATALLAQPELILVDEAFSNIDNREIFVSSFRDFASKGKIDVIFSTQQREDANLADHHYEMVTGTVTKVK